MYGKTGKSVPDTKILLWPPNVKSHHRDSARSPSQRQVCTLHQTHLTKGRRTPGQPSLRAWQATERKKADLEKFWCPTEEIRKDYKIAWEYKNNNGSQNLSQKCVSPSVSSRTPFRRVPIEGVWLFFFFLAGPQCLKLKLNGTGYFCFCFQTSHQVQVAFPQRVHKLLMDKLSCDF